MAKDFIIRLKSAGKSCLPFNCECNQVYIHIKPTVSTPIRTNATAPGDNMVTGNVTKIQYLGDIDRDGKCEWDYTITYDDTQLEGVDPSISTCDIELICCVNCELIAVNKIVGREIDRAVSGVSASVSRNNETDPVDISASAGSPYELNTLTVTLVNSSLNFDTNVVVDIAFDAEVTTLEDGYWDLSILKNAGHLKTLRLDNSFTDGETNQWFIGYKELVTVPADSTLTLIYSVEAATNADLSVGQAIVNSSNLEISAIGG